MPWGEGIGKPYVMLSFEIPVADKTACNNESEIVSVHIDNDTSEVDLVEQSSEPSALQLELLLEKSDPEEDRELWGQSTPTLPAAESLPEVSESQPAGPDTAVSNFFASLRQDSHSSCCCIAVALVALVLGSGGRPYRPSNLQILGVQAGRIEILLVRSWVSKLKDFEGFSVVRFRGSNVIDFEGASVVRLWGFQLAGFEGSSFVRFWGL